MDNLRVVVEANTRRTNAWVAVGFSGWVVVDSDGGVCGAAEAAPLQSLWCLPARLKSCPDTNHVKGSGGSAHSRRCFLSVRSGLRPASGKDPDPDQLGVASLLGQPRAAVPTWAFPAAL